MKLPDGCHRGLRNVHFLPAGMATRSPNSKVERLSTPGSSRQCYGPTFCSSSSFLLAETGPPRESIGSEVLPPTVPELMKMLLLFSTIDCSSQSFQRGIVSSVVG